MQAQCLRIAGSFCFETKENTDERGGFARLYDESFFKEQDAPFHWPQHNLSWNIKRGTLRGMHIQKHSHTEPKVVRCIRGSIYDVVVDLRPNSKTYLHWDALELSAANRKAFYIPGGCAHGFLTLEDHSEVYYLMGENYMPEYASGVRWNDPVFGINWPFDPVIISKKDQNWPDYIL